MTVIPEHLERIAVVPVESILESVKASYRLREIPVIVVGSHPELRMEAERLGAADFLEKPVGADQFEQAVEYGLAGSPWAATEA